MPLRGRRSLTELTRGFGSRMSRAIPLEELLLQLAERMRDHLALVRAEVWIVRGLQLEKAVGVPHQGAAPVALSDEARSVLAQPVVRGNQWLDVWLPPFVDARREGLVRLAPAVHGGELYGVLVAERAATARFASREEDALGDLGRQVGLALRNRQLDTALERSLDEVQRQAAELRASRARVVEAADSERRRIERDLHDGAQQQLLGLRVQLRLIRQALEGGGGRPVDELLHSFDEDIDTTIDQIRALAQGIFPAHLRSGGLAEALLVAAETTIPVSVDVRVGRLAESVEAAVYFCCIEALQNAAKHAGDGASARVTIVELRPGLLSVEVEDDGRGFATADVSAGAGLVNMRDRIGALGGELTIESEPGKGTRVHASVPLPPQSSRPPR